MKTGIYAGLAFLIALGALGLQVLMRPYVEYIAFILLYPAIVVSAYYLGVKLSFITLTVCSAGFILLFTPFSESGILTISELIRLAVFVLCGGAICFIIGRSRKANVLIASTLAKLENLQRAIDTSNIVTITDKEGVLKHVNEKFIEISGYGKKELIGKSHSMVKSDFHSEEFYKDLWDTILRGEVWVGEILNKAKNGSLFWVDTTITPFLNSKDDAYEFIAIQTDITSKKKTEQNLNKAKDDLEVEKARLNAIIEQMPAAVWVAEAPSGNISIGNALSRTLMKQPLLPANEIEQYGGYIGFKNGRRIDADEWPLARAILTGQKISNEMIDFEKADGSIGHARFDAAPIMNSTNEIMGGVVIGTDMTELIEYQKAVAQSEERLKRASESTGIGIWELNIKNLQLQRTSVHDQIYGLEYDPLLTFEDFFQKFLPEDAEKLKNNIRLIIEDEKPQIDEYRILWPDGSLHWIELNGSIQKDDEGNIINVIGTIIDITERKRTQSVLESIVDYSPLPIVIASLDGVVKLWNPAAEKLFGWQASDVKGKFLPVITDDGKSEFQEKMEDLKRGKRVENFQATRVRKDGTLLDVIISASPLPNKEDIIIVFADMTEMKHAEESMKKSEKLIQDIIDKSPYLTYIKNIYGKFILVNSEFAQSVNKTQNEILGKTDYDLFSPEDAASFTKHDEEVLETKKPHYYEESLEINGKEVTYMSMKFPLLDSAGMPYAIAGISVNISERKEMEVALKHRETELKSAIESRDRFLSIASHELKTPLTSMKLQLQIYRRQLQKGNYEFLGQHRVYKLISDTLKQTAALERLVNDMLDISRINTGKLTYRFHETEMCLMIREVVENIRPAIELTGSTLNVTLCEELHGKWDKQRLEQVIINLLNNASRYGEGHPIEIKTIKRNHEAVLMIIDKGRGIAKEDQDRIFGQFERAVERNDVSGFGLGLYISRNIIEAHGGRLTVESEEGVGSTFTIHLPLNAEIYSGRNLSI